MNPSDDKFNEYLSKIQIKNKNINYSSDIFQNPNLNSYIYNKESISSDQLPLNNSNTN